MSAEQSAKEALAVRIKRIREYSSKILAEVEDIENLLFPDLLNATPEARQKLQIFRKWNPMVLDLANGLVVLTQGLAAADKIIKG